MFAHQLLLLLAFLALFTSSESLRTALLDKARIIPDLEDSNLANYGSQAHIDARTAAAESEPAFVGAGAEVGVEVWRVENKRSASDTPEFGIAKVEADGTFYSGDCYVVLNTYALGSRGLRYDVHTWLGEDSTQDEWGVAAFKMTELSDLLPGGAVHHREEEGRESSLFLSYFPNFSTKEGGHESGFRHVEHNLW